MEVQAAAACGKRESPYEHPPSIKGDADAVDPSLGFAEGGFVTDLGVLPRRCSRGRR